MVHHASPLSGKCDTIPRRLCAMHCPRVPTHGVMHTSSSACYAGVRSGVTAGVMVLSLWSCATGYAATAGVDAAACVKQHNLCQSPAPTGRPVLAARLSDARGGAPTV